MEYFKKGKKKENKSMKVTSTYIDNINNLIISLTIIIAKIMKLKKVHLKFSNLKNKIFLLIMVFK
jgi:hypothetical protein